MNLRAAVAAFQRLPSTRRAELNLIWTEIVETIHTDIATSRRLASIREVQQTVDDARERFFYGVFAGWPNSMCRTCALTVLPGNNPMNMRPPK